MSPEAAPAAVEQYPNEPKVNRLKSLRRVLGRVAGAAVLIASGSITTFTAEEAFNPAVAQAETLGYPDYAMPCEHSPYNVSGGCANYDWGPVHTEAYDDPSEYSSRGYTYRNCTDYVAWKESTVGVTVPRTLGNGGQWYNNAPASERSTTPRPWDAAVVPGNPGHVTFVESVNNDGTITISEYNHGGVGTGDMRTGTPASMGLTEFVDFGVHPNETAPEAPKPGLGPGMKFHGTDHLGANETMGTGEYILSQNAQYLLALQTDGNLVLYGIGFNVLWTSNTANSGAAYAGMQSDGNLVLYTGYNRSVWSSNTGGRGVSSLFMQDDGNLVLYDNSLKSTWATSTDGHPSFNYYGSDILDTSKVLQRNQYIRSGDKRYGLLMQPDGNLVLYGPGYHVLWASGTDGKDGVFAGMQPDGNLVLYNSANQAVWSSNTAGRGNSFTALQSDGNLVVYTDGDKTPTWNSGTSGKL